MEQFPRIVKAVIDGQSERFYLVDQNFDFIPEVKELVDQKANTRRSPRTIRNLCTQLRWYYQFLNQRRLNVLEVQPSDLAEFVLWLSSPYRLEASKPKPIQASTINQILHAVAGLYNFLVRRGRLTESPVVYERSFRRLRSEVGGLVAHTNKGQGQTVERMEIRLKVPKTNPKTVSPADLDQFIQRIHVGKSPNADPSGFRDRVMVMMLKESGLRCGEMTGIHMEDLDLGAKGGVHVRFRPDNENGARAKAGYGRDRFVHLPPDILALLDVYITEVWVDANCESDYLWVVLKRNAVSRDGKRTFGKALTQTAVNETFAYYSERSGIKIHPHMLRHTHATDLVRSYLKKGEQVDWKFIADRLGHSSVITTMTNYVHLTKEDTKNAYKMYLENRELANAKRRQGKHLGV